MKKLLIGLAVLIVLLFTAYGYTQERSDFFPLKIGHFWIYTGPKYGRIHAEKQRVRKLQVTEMSDAGISDSQYTVVGNEYEHGGTEGEFLEFLNIRDTYRISGDSIVLTSTLRASTRPLSRNPSVPQLWLYYPLKKGQRWTVFSDDHGSFIEREVIGKDSVHVRAGTFANCIKVKETTHLTRQTLDKLSRVYWVDDLDSLLVLGYQWYAPGIGLVKETTAATARGNRAERQKLRWELMKFVSDNR